MTPNEEANRKDDLPLEMPEIALVRSSAYSIQSFSIAGLFALAVLYSLYFAADFILPVILAFLMSLFLLRLVRFLRKAGYPGTSRSGNSNSRFAYFTARCRLVSHSTFCRFSAGLPSLSR
jgi:hypothetical protein